MVWALFNEMLPDKDGKRAITMGQRTYDTQAEAQAQCDAVRRENLPFRAWPVEVHDPREPKVGDGTPDAALAIGEHAFRAGYEAHASGKYRQHVPVEAGIAAAWSDYDPPEHIKELS